MPTYHCVASIYVIFPINVVAKTPPLNARFVWCQSWCTACEWNDRREPHERDAELPSRGHPGAQDASMWQHCHRRREVMELPFLLTICLADLTLFSYVEFRYIRLILWRFHSTRRFCFIWHLFSFRATVVVDRGEYHSLQRDTAGDIRSIPPVILNWWNGQHWLLLIGGIDSSVALISVKLS